MKGLYFLLSMLVSIATLIMTIQNGFDIDLYGGFFAVYEYIALIRDSIFDSLYWILFSWNLLENFKLPDFIENLIAIYVSLGFGLRRGVSFFGRLPFLLSYSQRAYTKKVKWLHEEYYGFRNDPNFRPTFITTIKQLFRDAFLWPKLVIIWWRSITGTRQDSLDENGVHSAELATWHKRVAIRFTIGSIFSICTICVGVYLFFYGNYLQNLAGF